MTISTKQLPQAKPDQSPKAKPGNSLLSLAQMETIEDRHLMAAFDELEAEAKPDRSE